MKLLTKPWLKAPWRSCLATGSGRGPPHRDHRICAATLRCPTTTFILFDRMRRKRNDAFYDVTIISDAEAEQALSTSERFLLIVEADIKKRVP